jgi:hypothetical protein
MSRMKDLLGDQPYEDWHEPYGGDPPSVSHSETSQAAARQIKKRVGPLHLVIIKFLTDNPHGATDEEMQIRIPMPANTERPRRRELELLGRVADSGRRKLTSTGRMAVVWALIAIQKPGT